ncbi:MAG: manganese efflux pump [Clostridia bacterium]|nr:manganese efflux pump [Clostridia bacterium]
MNLDFLFFFNSALLGAALAMDAFSVSLANGLADSGINKRRATLIACVFAAFQAAMPLIGWFFVHTMKTAFSAFEPAIPWIALALLSFIGVKMIVDGAHARCGEEEGAPARLTRPALLLQGVATSIDALSVGFTIAEYDMIAALIAAAIIALVTFVICFAGVMIGKRFGTCIAGKATLFGGVILIIVGVEIFLTGIFG